MKTQTIIALLIFVLAACTPEFIATPTGTPIPTSTSTPLPPTSTLEATPVIVHPTILPTLLTIGPTLNPAQAEAQEELKSVIQAYFDLRYQALSVAPPEDFQYNGFGNLVSDEPDARDFLVTEMAKLAVERKWIDLNRFGYVEYEYSLKYKNIVVDAPAQIAAVSLLEDFTIVDERAIERDPEDPSITRGDQTHEIVLRKEQGQWRIISDTYRDAW